MSFPHPLRLNNEPRPKECNAWKFVQLRLFRVFILLNETVVMFRF